LYPHPQSCYQFLEAVYDMIWYDLLSSVRLQSNIGFVSKKAINIKQHWQAAVTQKQQMWMLWRQPKHLSCSAQRQHSTSFRRRDKLSVLSCSWAFKQQWSHPKDRQLPAVPDATTIESICQKLERLLPIYPISCMKYSYHIFVCLFRFWIFFPLKTNSPQIKLVNYS